jgi:hypothetical protein
MNKKELNIADNISDKSELFLAQTDDTWLKRIIHTKRFWFFYLPMIIYLGLSTISFIVATFYDLQIAAAAGKLMRFKAVRVFVLIYDEIGDTQLFFAEIFAIAILWECFVSILAIKTKVKFFQHWTFPWIAYAIILFVWNFCNITRCVHTITGDAGLGVGNDPKAVLSYWWRFGVQLGIHIVETVAMCWVIYYMRFQIKDKAVLIDEEYYIGCLKMIFHVFITYFILIVLKRSFGRPFYYSVDFHNIYQNELQPLGWDFEYTVMWGSGDGTENATYFAWYEPNDFLGNIKYWFNDAGAKGDSNSWWNNDFPSGHTVGTFCLFALFFYIVANDDKKINKKTVIFFWTILAHITILQISLLIYRFHWLTDLNFSTMFCIPCFWLVNWLGNLAGYLLRTSIRAWTGKENHAVFIYQKNKWSFYLVNPYNQQLEFVSNLKNHEKAFSRRIKKYKLTNYEKYERENNKNNLII